MKYIPDSTFYIWLNLEGLPPQLADGLNFFQACVEEKVIVVPGIFFDLNPSRRRDLFDSPCHHCKWPMWPVPDSARTLCANSFSDVRLSYGPRMEVLKRACDGIERVVKKYKK